MKTINAKCVTSDEIARKIITFENGIIKNIKPATMDHTNVDYFYDDSFLLFSGMGDIHIHAREDVSKKHIYKEDFQSTKNAALNGGVAFVADMPNNPIPPIDDESYLNKLSLIKNLKFPIFFYAGVGPNTHPLSFLIPYKVYMGPSIGELFFKDQESLSDALSRYQGQSISFHCEDPVILDKNQDQKNHFLKRPVSAEIMATHTAISLTEKFHLKAKLCHYSSGEGLTAILKAKEQKLDITMEVTPTHLYFTEEMILKLPADLQVHFQMNPPIRNEDDRLRLLEALKKGEIDFLATDHAPHSHEEKCRGTSGLPGLDTFGAFTTHLMVNESVDPKIIAKVASENPGDFVNQFLNSLNQVSDTYKDLGLGLGHLKEGFSASFTVLNMQKSYRVTAQKIKSKSAWSPFLNHTFPGSVEAVFLKGQNILTSKC